MEIIFDLDDWGSKEMDDTFAGFIKLAKSIQNSGLRQNIRIKCSMLYENEEETKQPSEIEDEVLSQIEKIK